ncbi:unnamed protein product, partial [Prorocentrum cordatum]
PLRLQAAVGSGANLPNDAAAWSFVQIVDWPATLDTESARNFSLSQKRSHTSVHMGQAQGLSKFGCCGPERKPEPVTLNIYDLHGKGRGIFKGMNVLLRAAGTGAFHVGLEVFGQEYSFGYREGSGTGVFSHAPRESEIHSFRESIFMGDTDLTQYEVEKLMKRMKARWLASSYETLSRNCCHFCDELCLELRVGRPSFVPLPEWLNSLTAAGNAWGGSGQQDDNASEVHKFHALEHSAEKSSRKRPAPVEVTPEPIESEGQERTTSRQSKTNAGLTISIDLRW